MSESVVDVNDDDEYIEKRGLLSKCKIRIQQSFIKKFYK